MIEVFSVRSPYKNGDFLLRPQTTARQLYGLIAATRAEADNHAVLVLVRTMEPDDFWDHNDSAIIDIDHP